MAGGRVFGSLQDKGVVTVGGIKQLGLARQITADEIVKDALVDEEAETLAAISCAEADALRIDMKGLDLKLRRPPTQTSTMPIALGEEFDTRIA